MICQENSNQLCHTDTTHYLAWWLYIYTYIKPCAMELNFMEHHMGFTVYKSTIYNLWVSQNCCNNKILYKVYKQSKYTAIHGLKTILISES